MLLATLQIFDTFGAFSGIKINWSTSILFPIDRDATTNGRPLFPAVGGQVPLPLGSGNQAGLQLLWEKKSSSPVINSEFTMFLFGQSPPEPIRAYQYHQNDDVAQI